MHSEFIIFLFIILGFLSGLLGGLLGIGGGVITVPVLYFIFQYAGGTLEERAMQIAVSTSLAVGFVTSAVSTLAQLKKKAVSFHAIKFLAAGLIIGCAIGSLIAHYLTSNLLSVIFGGMAILIGIYFFFPRLPHLHIRPSPDRTLSLFGLFIGCFSSMLGIGGGSLTFPILLGYQMPAKNASATSSGSTLITTLFGSMTYMLIAWHQPELPQTFGYIQLPSFIAVGLGSAIASPFGVHLSHVLHVALIKRIFGCSLSLIGFSMFIL